MKTHPRTALRRCLVVVFTVLGGLVLQANIANAGIGAAGTPTFPESVQVGQKGLAASIRISNQNTDPNLGTTNTVCNFGDPAPCSTDEPGITLTPSCGKLGAFSACATAGADPHVLKISPTGVGEAGSSCAAMNFKIEEISASTGLLRITPTDAAPNDHIKLVGFGAFCIIDFTFDVLRVPSVDSNSGVAGAQTIQITDNTQQDGTTPGSGRGTFQRMTIRQATPTIATTASPSVVVGGAISDTATVSGRVSAVAGATVTFNAYAPTDTTCSGTPVFTSTVPITPTVDTVASGSFTPSNTGAYRWTATYNGDVNNAAITEPCNAANEAVTVTPASPTIATSASGTVPLSLQISDQATVSGRVNPIPGATVTFNLYGPNDATCSGAVVFTSTVTVDAAGKATSAPFTPTMAGTYRWTASYSGDANNNPVAGPCNAADESVNVTPVTPTIATRASGDVPLTLQISDQATVSGRVNPIPGATVTFNLYGPNDATCSGLVVFRSTVDIDAAGKATSGSFTPTLPGVYRWTASYSGDANNNPVAGPCNAANESVTVNAAATPTISTKAAGTLVVGGQLTDQVTVAGRLNPQPGATVTFNLYGPNDATCSGAVIFTSTVPLNTDGTAVSAPYTPSQPGVYRWTAAYSGDRNNNPVTEPCNGANETVTVTTVASPTISTVADGTLVVGGVLTDQASVAGRVNPIDGATITFKLYGPNDETCIGPAIFTATVGINAAGSASSGPFTPPTAGVYRWVAAYSGDANNNPVSGACGEATETVTVAKSAPSISTISTPSTALGGSITDQAVVQGLVNPVAGATVTFSLYGPDDVTCANPAVFTSTVPLAPDGTAVSGPFAPTALGVYRWIAGYNGDVNNAAVTAACNAPNESAALLGPDLQLSLPVTGSTTTVPLVLGAFLVGGGGMLLLIGRRRPLRVRNW